MHSFATLCEPQPRDRRARPRLRELAPGTYESQTLEYDPTKNSPERVVIQTRVGEKASIPRLDLGQSQFDAESETRNASD